jgi:WD40 repeat protein
MDNISSKDNLIIKRRSNITDILCDYFPKDVAKLISNYDYYLEGKIVHSFKDNTSIRCIAILSDGRIVSGSDDCTLKIWNLQTGKCDIIFRGHVGMVMCTAALSDGRIISGSTDKTLKIWNL